MATPLVISLVLLFACQTCHAGFPGANGSPPLSTPNTKRAFHDTPDGQIHFVMGGDFKTQTTLLLLHGHPRSSTEFRDFVHAIEGHYAFVAVDYFGFGASDDCLTCNSTSNEHVDVVRWGDYAVDIMKSLGVTNFVPVGSLKGTYTAIYLSHAYPTMVNSTVLVLPCWLTAKTLATVEGFIAFAKHPAPFSANGSHLLAAWNDPSGGGSLDVAHNEDKTLDNLRARKDSWSYMWHMVDYNDKMLAAMSEMKGNTLLVWGLSALSSWNNYGFQTTAMRTKIEATLKEGNPSLQVQVLPNGTEGSMTENGATIATWVQDFLG